MKIATIKPSSCPKSATLQTTKVNPLSHELLLKMLALGKREIEEGKFQDVENVFAQLK